LLTQHHRMLLTDPQDLEPSALISIKLKLVYPIYPAINFLENPIFLRFIVKDQWMDEHQMEHNKRSQYFIR